MDDNAQEDLARLSGPDVFGFRRWNRDWMTIGIAWAQDRRARAAAVRDAVVAMDAGATAPTVNAVPSIK